MMKCSDVMTKDPVCCQPEDTVDRIAGIMRDEDIGPVPIVDERMRLMGIVTDRDLAIKVVAERKDPGSTTARDVMTTNVKACNPDDDLEEALESMSTHQLRRIPVVDADRRIVGIIAQADIASVADEEETGEVVKDISQ